MAERSNVWNKLVEEYWRAAPVPPKLRGVTLAQWALESNWGNSELAKQHFNFGGMKWREERLKEVATPVEYIAHDGNDTYAKFMTLRDWITGYWSFIERGPYNGWREYLNDAEGYIRHLKSIGYAEDPDYVEKVMKIYREGLTEFERTGNK